MVDMARVRQSLMLADPRRRTDEVLAGLGWDEHPDLSVAWEGATARVGRFVLGTDTSSAGVVEHGTDDLGSPARFGWLADLRWVLAPAVGSLRWLDFNRRIAHDIPVGELHEGVLEGLTPRGFLRSGRFEPHVPKPLSTFDFPVPDGRVTHYLASKLEALQLEYIRLGRPDSVASAQMDFVHFAAALIFLRTVEDLNRLPWLSHGALKASADRGRDSFGSLLQRASRHLNTRILATHGHRCLEVHGFVRHAVESLTDEHVDFAALDVDPVGSFYEKLLEGLEHDDQGQPGLPGLGVSGTLRRDKSWRRTTGTYYTPRTYADALARRLVRPRVRLARSSRELPIVVDLAAGSGELICAALRQVFSEPDFCCPDVARAALGQFFYAVDIQPTAIQLCALNVLRTAIRSVPELVEQPRLLPDLTRNFVTGNALSQETLSQIPLADVVVLNPPFRGSRRWSVEGQGIDDPVPAVNEVPSAANLALVFYAAAVDQLRPGGGIGVVLPSNQLDSQEGRPWRKRIAERSTVELVVANFATSFTGVNAHPGFVIGTRLGGVVSTRPRSRKVTIQGAARAANCDIAAYLSSHIPNRYVKDRLTDPIQADSMGWMTEATPIVSHTSGRVRLDELLATKIHQGVLPAPREWGRELFLFRECDRGLEHVPSGHVIGSDSSHFYPAAWPNLIQKSLRTPPLGEPRTGDHVLFYPPGVDEISDEPACEAMRLIERLILARRGDDSLTGTASRYVERVVTGRAHLSEPRGFSLAPEPLLIFAKTSRSPSTSEVEIAWSCWINEDGATVPLGGLWARAPTFGIAAMVGAWFMNREIVDHIILGASGRSKETHEPRVASLNSLLVPDLRSSRFESALSTVESLVYQFREMSLSTDEASAIRHPLFRQILKTALDTWRSV